MLSADEQRRILRLANNLSNARTKSRDRLRLATGSTAGLERVPVVARARATLVDYLKEVG